MQYVAEYTTIMGQQILFGPYPSEKAARAAIEKYCENNSNTDSPNDYTYKRLLKPL